MRDARGRTPELVALDLGHVDCAGLFYNMDIHSYTPKLPDANESGAGEGHGRYRGHGEGRSDEDDDDATVDVNASAYGGSGASSYQRDGEAGAGGGAQANTTSLRQGFHEAVAVARRASSLSMQQQPEEEEGQADPRRPPRGSVSSFASGDGAAQGDGEAEEGRRAGQQRQGYGYNGDFVEQRENAQQYTEGYDGEGNDDAEGERADWEWSETEGWVRARDGGSDAPAETQAPEDEQQQDTRTAADKFGDGEEGYSGEGYGDPRQSESDWQQPYCLTVQGDSHGGSYDGTDQGDHQQQQQFSSGQVGGDGSYDTPDGVNNDDNTVPQQGQQTTNSSERAGWEEPGRGDSVELLQETGVAAAGEDGNSRDLFEAALGEGWAPSGSDKETAADDELGQNTASAANHNSTNKNDRDDNDGREQEIAAAEASSNGNSEDGSGERDVYSSAGWGSAVAVDEASNRWVSRLDRSSSNVYYQNERSGRTEWDLPEGAVVVSDTPEDA